jgi:hypothetical protein
MPHFQTVSENGQTGLVKSVAITFLKAKGAVLTVRTTTADGHGLCDSIP